jgi:hypothetical protein
VACKLVFTMPFYCACKGFPLWLFIVTLLGYKAGGCPLHEPTSFHMTSHRLLASFPMAKKKRDREVDLETWERVVEHVGWGYKSGGCPLHEPTSSHTTSHRLLASFPMAKKKREI